MSARARLLTGVLALGSLAVLQSPVMEAHASPIRGEVTVTGPVVGDPFPSAAFDVSGNGYTESEYFQSGSARAFGAQLPDAEYTTRMIVYRPADPARFSGNVIVEWNNVSGGADTPVDVQWLHQQVMASGDAYVGVSVQQGGTCGNGLDGLAGATCSPTSLEGRDPARYEPLHLPGDDYAFDIFSQSAASLRDHVGADPLAGLEAQNVLAIGLSQSALELDNYIKTGADDDARVFDGFLIDADSHATPPTSYRVPTLHLWSEDAAHPEPAEPIDNHVSWQIAGAPHVDTWGNAFTTSSAAQSPAPIFAPEISSADNVGNYGQQGPSADDSCLGGSGFPRRYAVDAALTALGAWVQDGLAPPRPEPFQFTDLAIAADGVPPLPDIAGIPLAGVNGAALLTAPFSLARDGYGNALGGVRLPVVTVPVASYVGNACILAGTSVPLPPETLRALYPTHSIYVDKLLVDTAAAVQQRYMTLADGVDLLERACVSAVPSWGTTPEDQRPEACGDLENRLQG